MFKNGRGGVAGTGPGAHNVIPDSVELKGTIRALTARKFDHLRERVTEVSPPRLYPLPCDFPEPVFVIFLNHFLFINQEFL